MACLTMLESHNYLLNPKAFFCSVRISLHVFGQHVLLTHERQIGSIASYSQNNICGYLGRGSQKTDKAFEVAVFGGIKPTLRLQRLIFVAQLLIG